MSGKPPPGIGFVSPPFGENLFRNSLAAFSANTCNLLHAIAISLTNTELVFQNLPCNDKGIFFAL